MHVVTGGFPALFAPQLVNAERISNGKETTRRRVGNAKPEVKIDLMLRRDPVRRAKVSNLPWSAALSEIAGIFDKGVPWFRDLFFDIKRRFPVAISSMIIRIPEQALHTADRPTGLQFLRPRELNERVVTVAGTGWRLSVG